MSIKSKILIALVGVGTLTLAGCVEGGGYSGGYVTSYGGPYYGDGYYRDYGYYHGYRRDDRYYRPRYADHRRDYDGPRGPRNGPGPGPGREFHRDGGDNGQVILPNPNTPRGPVFSRGGN